MTQVEQMAEFVNGVQFDALGTDIRQQLKIRILDALGRGLVVLDWEPIRMIRGYINELGGTGKRAGNYQMANLIDVQCPGVWPSQWPASELRSHARVLEREERLRNDRT